MNDIISVRFFGTFQLVSDDSDCSPPPSGRLQNLFAWLLLNRHTIQWRQQVAQVLWIHEASDSAAFARLRKALSDLNKSVTLFRDHFNVTNHQIQFRHSIQIVTDVEQFEDELAKAAAAAEKHELALRIDHLEAAIALYQGEFLELLVGEWIESRRAIYRQQYCNALRQLADCLEIKGDLTKAERYAKCCLEVEPEFEENYQRLMRVCGKLGKSQPIEHYFSACEAMLADVGETPNSITLETYHQARLRSRSLYFAQLPTFSSPLFGRGREIATLIKWVNNPEIRLINIVGMGGIGKTRLAIELSEKVRELFAHGICFVPLVSLKISDSILPAIASALSCHLNADDDPQTVVGESLGDKHLLLVLDNFERLIDQSSILHELLRAAPAIKIVVTSRQRLNLADEWNHELGGLSFFVPADATVANKHAIGTQDENAALQLFQHHAQRLNHTFSADQQQSSILQICQQVEGVPLAIEMMASWSSSYSCAEINEKLRQSFHFLSHRAAQTASRHHSMYIVFEQSWRLLTQAQQRTFAQLSIFADGFTLDAARRVTGINEICFHHLLDHQLVKQGDGSRFVIHELLRQFGADKLDVEPTWQAEATCNYCDYFLALLHQHERAIIDGDRATLLALSEDTKNLQQAMRWTVERRQSKLISLAYLGFLFFWEEQGLLAEGATFFEWADGEWQKQPPVTRAERLVQAQLRLALLCLDGLRANNARVRQKAAELQSTFAALKDPNGYALALLYDGLSAVWSGNIQEAEPILLQAVAAGEATNFSYVMGAALIHLGEIHRLGGNYAEAEKQYGESLQLARRIASGRGVGISLIGLGALAAHYGDAAQALRLLAESEQIALNVHDFWVANIAQWRQAHVAAAIHELASARNHLARALHSALATRNAMMQHSVMIVAAQVLQAEGDHARSAEYLTCALEQPNLSFENRILAQGLLEPLVTQMEGRRLSLAQTLGRARQLDETLGEIAAWLRVE